MINLIIVINNLDTEQKMWNLGKKQHQEFKAKMYKQSEDTISKIWTDSY